MKSPLCGSVILSLLCVAILAAPYQPNQQVLDHSLVNPGDIVAVLKQAEVIPDVLPHDFSPHLAITLTYPEAHETVNFGNVIDPTKTQMRPVLQISGLAPTQTTANKTYTLVLSDPDATSHAKPVKGQMCHWIATGINFTGSHTEQQLELRDFDLSDDNAFDASDLVNYLPPSPPPKTGLHRYVFVLLEPKNSKHEDRKLKAPKDRPRWGYKKKGKGVMKWAKKNKLVPVAANYFLAQNEKQ